MFLTIKLGTYDKVFRIELLVCIRMDLILNNLHWLIYRKTKRDQIIYI